VEHDRGQGEDGEGGGDPCRPQYERWEKAGKTPETQLIPPHFLEPDDPQGIGRRHHEDADAVDDGQGIGPQQDR
jgi:hypothetical protein